MKGADPLSRPGRMLVVEDEYLAACELESLLTALDCRVVGPVPDCAAAAAALDAKGVDAALLDIALCVETVYPLADRLTKAGVAFAFVTGYAQETIPARFTDRPVLQKPVSKAQLAHVLSAMRSGR